MPPADTDDDRTLRRQARAARRTRRQRVRRDPEAARALIRSAAREVLAERGPDAVGLKDVAQAAGVSHALVSHYFGTKAQLIEAVFRDHTDGRRNRLFDAMREGLDEGPRAWMRAYLQDAARPEDARLMSWAMLSGQLDADGFFDRQRGLQHTVDLLEAQLQRRGHHDVKREDIMFGAMLMVVVPHGYAVGRRAIWGSLGEPPSEERDAWFFERFLDLMEGLITAPNGRSDDD